MAPVVLTALVVGLVFGSFANVPIHRWPRGGTVTVPATSACPHCGAPVRPRDNVPVLSWLLLRGRCRGCAEPIAIRYPLVEAGMGVLFGATAFVHSTWSLVALLPFVWVVVVAAIIDLEHRIIPNRLTYPALPLLLGLLLIATVLGSGTWPDLGRALIAGVAVPAAMLLVSETFRLVRGMPGIGMGDIKLAPSIGLVVGYLGGWELVIWFYATAISAVVIAAGLMLAGKAKLATRIPYGPYLAIGALTAVLFGEPLTDVLARLFGLA